ncbi:MAG: hypothetical protein R3E11_03380 [Sphingobium sp.]|jgi:hypothetical protein|nr:hypothetical protein [Sphingobium sp.]MCP5398536.1 hypothetical protein [Sphingomonas sp.]
MSQDKRPAPVRTVSVASENGDGEPAGEEETVAAISGDDSSDAQAETKSGLPVTSMLLFLIGCAAGGAVIAALPHYMQGLSGH